MNEIVDENLVHFKFLENDQKLNIFLIKKLIKFNWLANNRYLSK